MTKQKLTGLRLRGETKMINNEYWRKSGKKHGEEIFRRCCLYFRGIMDDVSILQAFREMFCDAALTTNTDGIEIDMNVVEKIIQNIQLVFPKDCKTFPPVTNHCVNPHEIVYRGCSNLCKFFEKCDAVEKVNPKNGA
jgi:hypothetical protein